MLATDKKTGKPAVDVILDSAGQKGTGRWAAIEAQMLGIPGDRHRSSSRRPFNLVARQGAERGVESLWRSRHRQACGQRSGDFIDALEDGLLAGKIAAYAQGFDVMAGASKEHGWNIPLATTARIWRAGCIIRSQFLDQIAAAFEGSEGKNLLLAPAFVERMKAGSNHCARSLRRRLLQACRRRRSRPR